MQGFSYGFYGPIHDLPVFFMREVTLISVDDQVGHVVKDERSVFSTRRFAATKQDAAKRLIEEAEQELAKLTGLYRKKIAELEHLAASV
jgi:hypothetical protein